MYNTKSNLNSILETVDLVSKKEIGKVAKVNGHPGGHWFAQYGTALSECVVLHDVDFYDSKGNQIPPQNGLVGKLQIKENRTILVCEDDKKEYDSKVNRYQYLKRKKDKTSQEQSEFEKLDQELEDLADKIRGAEGSGGLNESQKEYKIGDAIEVEDEGGEHYYGVVVDVKPDGYEVEINDGHQVIKLDKNLKLAEAKLSTSERDALPSSDFVFPSTREYPIPDEGHAHAALIDSKGTDKESAVRAAVKRKFGWMTEETLKEDFKVGDKVVDKDGYKGIITKITNHQDSKWYDVRFFRDDGSISGEAVRYDGDLKLRESVREEFKVGDKVKIKGKDYFSHPAAGEEGEVLEVGKGKSDKSNIPVYKIKSNYGNEWFSVNELEPIKEEKLQENSLSDNYQKELENMSDEDFYKECLKAVQMTKDTSGSNIWRDNACQAEAQNRKKKDLYLKAVSQTWNY